MSNRLNENTARAIQEAMITRKVKILVGMYDAIDGFTAFRIEFKKNQILQIDEYQEDHDGIREKRYTVHGHRG
ncbi:MAG: hypothetical protein IJV59_07570 [Eubacterium sp.]|nr:hypothetical protein [Eubacterium sp.]